jgi:hypothetical protein
VQLRFFHRLNWQHDTDLLVATATTGKDGAFGFEAPAGEYLFEVVVDAQLQVQRAVAVPAAQELVVDLAAGIQVTVEVVDAQGQPVANHNVAVSAAGGQKRSGRTGADGRAGFGPFEPGAINAMAPLEASKDSWTGKVFATVDAAPGSRPVLQLRLPRRESFHARLAFDGGQPEHGFTGFTARDVSVGVAGKDVAVDADGTVAIDLLPQSQVLVKGPDERQWRFTLPADLQRDPTLVLRWSGLAYAGVLMDGSGAVVPHARVFATPLAGGVSSSALTDAAGVFRLDGLEPRRYQLAFHVDGNSTLPSSGGNPLAKAVFETSELPSIVPVQLQLRVPRFADGAFVDRDNVEIIGSARDANGAAVANALVSAMTLVDQPGGVLRLYAARSWQFSAADGGFRLIVARGDRYRSGVARVTGQPVVHAEWQPQQRGDRIEHDIVVQ